MQRLAAVQVRDKKRVGNWSGTGAGKTLSAVLASRVIDAHLTVICCPNSVVDGWEKAILYIFPDSVVAKKTFIPDWKPNPPAPFPAREGGERLLLPSPMRRGVGGEVNHYLILNYEIFQQPNSANWVRTLINNQQIDFIVIDEIHYTKQRQVEDISKRKQLVSTLITAAAERNRHTVYSFDHIAVNNKVIACDMAHVPLEDEALDVAIFSLSLMGSNFTDYLREAYRTLKLDGQLHIIEATSRFSDRDRFRNELEILGFDVVNVQDRWKFTHIRAIKAQRRLQEGVRLQF